MRAFDQVNTNSEISCGSWPDRPRVEQTDQVHLVAELGREQALAFMAYLAECFVNWPKEGVWIKISNEKAHPERQGI